MIYCKTSQPVPGKGDAWTFYECTDEKKIVRYVTVVSETGEVEKVPDPVVTRLFRPDLVEPSTKEEFDRHWSQK